MDELRRYKRFSTLLKYIKKVEWTNKYLKNALLKFVKFITLVRTSQV